MIASCPKCEARYRVDEDQIGEEGARLKCAKCQAVFRVVAPVAGSEPAGKESRAMTNPSPQTAPPESGVVDRGRLILVADPNEDSGKRTAQALSEWGLHPILVHDGVEAMLTIQRMLPRLVVLDAALPKMYGFQVCEIIKRNESLRETCVVLVGAIHNQNRYHRPPTDLYGADLYLEQPDLPDGLMQIIRDVGITIQSPAAPTSSPPIAPPKEAPQAPPIAPPETAPQAPPVAMPSPQAKADPDDGLADERAKAERLARIVVSDIVLYQPDKFAAALSQGSVVEAMDAEIQEGRALFRQRVHESVREEKDYIVEELLRIAQKRGMQ